MAAPTTERCASHTTDLLTEGLKDALSAAGLPAGADVSWEVPRDERHGDYATNVAMTLARAARQPPRKVAEAIVAHFPRSAAVERLEIAGPGFLNVFLSPAWCAGALGDILARATAYGAGRGGHGRALSPRVRLGQPHRARWSSSMRAPPRSAMRSRGSSGSRATRSTTQYYVNDAGNQFHALARSFVVRAAAGPGRSGRAAGERPTRASTSSISRRTTSSGDPGGRARPARAGRSAERIEEAGRHAVEHMVAGQRQVLARLRHPSSTAGPTRRPTCARRVCRSASSRR